MGEQVTAEQCPGLLLEDNARVPSVRNMRRVDEPDTPATQVQYVIT